MWDDEASVVWFAENYNKYGEILGYDGINLFSYRNGQLINDQLVYNNPPLDIYYTSYVIRFFGSDDFTVRLSFALLGFIALGLFVGCFRMIAGKNTGWFLYGSAFLLLSTNYLLIEGNSRYYSLTFLFGSLSLLATLQLVKGELSSTGFKIIWLIIQLISIYFMFLSHYLAAVCWWVMCFFILLQNKTIRINSKHGFTWIAALLNIACLFFVGKYFLQHKVLSRPDMINEDSMGIKYLKLFGWLFNDLNRVSIIPFIMTAVIVFLFLFKRKILTSEFKKLMAFSLVFLFLSALLNPQPTSKSICFDIRYIYPAFPLLYLIAGYLFSLIHQHFRNGKYISFILAVIYINSTLLSFMPNNTPVRWLLPNFVKERIFPFPTAYTASLDYIKSHFKERKKILTIPGYHNTVFLRYYSDKIEITNTLDINTPLSKKVVDSLGMNCLFMKQCKPDFVFLFGKDAEYELSPYKAADYRYVDTIPVFASGTDITRPELFWHSFGPVKNIDLSKDALYIFHD